MGSDVDRPPACHVNSPQERPIIVAAVHPSQCVVIDRFDTELERHQGPPRDLINHFDLLLIYAVRAGADRQSYNFGMVDRIRIEFAQVFCFGVSIRKGLKVDDELVGIESLANVFDTFADLIADRISLYSRRRPERVVVAVRAAADGNRSVSIRAGESRVDNDLIYSFAESF